MRKTITCSIYARPPPTPLSNPRPSLNRPAFASTPTPKQGWLQKAHLGITATTGQLADNHDILSLHTFNDLGIHPEADDLVVTPKFGAWRCVCWEMDDGCVYGCIRVSHPTIAPSHPAHKFTPRLISMPSDHTHDTRSAGHGSDGGGADRAGRGYDVQGTLRWLRVYIYMAHPCIYS